MKGLQIPPGWQVEILSNTHNRRSFSCGADEVDSWLKAKAKQTRTTTGSWEAMEFAYRVNIDYRNVVDANGVID